MLENNLISSGSTSQIDALFDKYPFLMSYRGKLQALVPKELEVFIQTLSDFAIYQESGISLLRKILNTYCARDILFRWGEINGTGKLNESNIRDDLHATLDHPFTAQALHLVVDARTYEERNAASVFMARVPDKNMPSSVRSRVCPQYSDATITIFAASGFYNCQESENYLDESVAKKETVLVNKSLLVKRKGYQTALCLKTTSTTQGTFLRGGWYSPFDDKSKEAIRDALQARRHTLTLHEGQWAYVRPFQLKV
ncbi:MAG TPA: hypothetical protein VMR41_02690 [Patescibacteria group bacterium]|nr:hypothetical protein [Patescibacteria group bacterium]